MRTFIGSGVVLAGLLLVAVPAAAQERLTPGVDEPFSGISSPSREAARVMQSFIDSSFLTDVTAPTTITGLSWRLPAIANTSYPNADITFPRYEITLAEPSAAAAAANGLTSNTFADNMSDPLLVRSGPMTITAGSFTDNDTGPGAAPAGQMPAEFSFVIPFTVPYTILPGEDLVVLIRHSGYGTPQQTSWDFDGFAYTNGGRVATNDVNATSGSLLPNTVLKYALIVPEPSSAALLLMGGLLAMRRGRRA